MKIKAVLFDLDGTLLPMDQDLFVKEYLGRLSKKMTAYGYEPKQLVETIWNGTMAMYKNDGSRTNETLFWEVFTGVFGEESKEHIPVFDEYYRNEFQEVKHSCGFNPKANETIKKIKELGYRVALATNPLFPQVATASRMRWAGLDLNDFEFYTTYETSSYCKPNPDYYLECAKMMGLYPEECLMVGNDATEDMVAEKVGMDVFLLTDCLLNREEKDITKYPQGSFEELIAYVTDKI